MSPGAAGPPAGHDQHHHHHHLAETGTSGPAGHIRPPQHIPLLPRNPDANAGRAVTPLTSNVRQRVRRACFECRTKKVKCNGAEPCARCSSYGVACEYVEYSATATRLGGPGGTAETPCARPTLTGDLDANSQFGSQVERLESRVASIEHMFKQFLQEFRGIQNHNVDSVTMPMSNADDCSPHADPARSTNPDLSSTAQQVPVHDLDIPSSGDDSLGGDSVANPNPNASKIQQLLDAAEADVAACIRPERPPRSGDAQKGRVPGRLEAGVETVREPYGLYPEHDQESTALHEADGGGRCYADGFGELDVDTHGQLRYVGLGSTASVAVENCIGLRRYITKGLEKKGYDSEETFFTSPEATHLEKTTNPSWGHEMHREMPPPALVDVLITIYAKELANLFPITSEESIRETYRVLSSDARGDPGHAAVFFALLAVAAPLLPDNHTVFDTIDSKWRSEQLGTSFYNQSMRYVNLPFNGKIERRGRSQDIVTALGLISMYLAEIGAQAEAWISVGRAIRIAQDIGLHRSPERLRLPHEQWNRRRFIWWCLYILERQLCTALGRPVSIDDQDCDTEIPSPIDATRANEFAGFTSMIHLHRIIGTILKTVNSVRNADSWQGKRDSKKMDELRVRVRQANDDLQAWARDMVPQHIKTAKSGTLLAEKHIVLSSFFSATMLLHRMFIRNPHRTSPLTGSQAQIKCAKSATDCIRGHREFFESVPKSHFVVFHGQYVFVSALVLLACIRWSDDPKFVFSALKDVEQAMEALRSLETFWKGARKCCAIVEEYLDFSFHVLQGDRKCHFDCEFGHQRHDTRSCNSKKRPALQSGTTGIEPKRRRPVGSMQLPTELSGRVSPAQPSHPHGRETGTSSDSFPLHVQPSINNNGLISRSPSAQLGASRQQPSMLEDTYFDNTINNFLFEFRDDHVGGSLETGFDPSGLLFLSPENGNGYLQNSFF